ncbi:MAG: HD domain-containing protein [Candidatus Aenigmarchaeota archaeon]|nr:HD domain-containing protein [Candidatus Aenigmarchaeota archaeon]
MNILKFLQEVNKLKQLKRTGWVERGVKDAESSADHSFMTAFHALVLGSKRKDLNMEKVLKMALIHELAESQVGDIVLKEVWPGGGTMTFEEKHKIEKEALDKLLDNLDPKMRNEFMNLWEESEKEETKDAVFLKSVDRAETILQAIEYHKKGNYKKSVESFWDENGLSFIKDKEVKKTVLKAI